MTSYGTLDLHQVCTRGFSSGIEWPECEANHSSPSSIKVMSLGFYLSSLACVYFMVLMQSDNVTCIWQGHGETALIFEKEK
jgi:hypothetical protein